MRFHVLLATVALSVSIATRASAAPVVVSCGPGQHAVVRTTVVRGEEVTRLQCVGGATYRDVAYRTRYVTQERVVRPRRSWGKSALVIGGSTATGAGIGGIIHGTKGALIGAALGGGAGSLYEATRRR